MHNHLFVAVIAPVISMVAAAQEELTCSAHPSIVFLVKGSCPICGKELVARSSASTGAHEVRYSDVAADLLKPYCRRYLSRAIAMETADYPYELLEAFIAVADADGRRRLRAMIGQSGPWRLPAARLLAQTRNSEAEAALRLLMTAPVPHACPVHYDEKSTTSGACQRCGGMLQPVFSELQSRILAAGTLHSLGDERALVFLESLSGTKDGFNALLELAARDTVRVREILRKDWKRRSRAHRLAAVAGRLRLGMQGAEETARHLFPDSTAAEQRLLAYGAYLASDSPLKGELKRACRNDEVNLSVRVCAAMALVRMGEVAGEKFLLDAWHKADPAQRAPIYDALAEVGNSTVALNLLRRAIVEDPTNRPLAIIAAARASARRDENRDR